jgi:hypothetical protein
MTVKVAGLEKVSCNRCGSTRSLVYHHITYEPEKVEVVCSSCHRQEHGKHKVRPENFVSKVVIEYQGTKVYLDTETKARLLKALLQMDVKEGGLISFSGAVARLLDVYEREVKA